MRSPNKIKIDRIEWSYHNLINHIKHPTWEHLGSFLFFNPSFLRCPFFGKRDRRTTRGRFPRRENQPEYSPKKMKSHVWIGHHKLELKRFPFLFMLKLKNEDERSGGKSKKSWRKPCSKWGMQDVFLFHKNLDKAVIRSIPLIPQKVDENDSPLSKSQLKSEVS